MGRGITRQATSHLEAFVISLSLCCHDQQKNRAGLSERAMILLIILDWLQLATLPAKMYLSLYSGNCVILQDQNCSSPLPGLKLYSYQFSIKSAQQYWREEVKNRQTDRNYYRIIDINNGIICDILGIFNILDNVDDLTVCRTERHRCRQVPASQGTAFPGCACAGRGMK